MEGWASNPATWIIGSLSLLSVVIGASIAFGAWKGKVDTNQSHFKTTLDSFMVEIRADIKRIFERLPSETVSGTSPLRLTAKGKSISQTLDAARWAEDIAPSLAHRVEGMVPYDIQEFCRSYVRDEFQPTPKQEAKIKACAYDNALDRHQVFDVLAVELRDQLLSP